MPRSLAGDGAAAHEAVFRDCWILLQLVLGGNPISTPPCKGEQLIVWSVIPGQGWRCQSCVIPPAQEWFRDIQIYIYIHTHFLSAAQSISLLSSYLRCPVPWLHNPAFAQITDSSSSIFLLELIFWVIDHFHCSLVNQSSCFPSDVGGLGCAGWKELLPASPWAALHPPVILALMSSL